MLSVTPQPPNELLPHWQGNGDPPSLSSASPSPNPTIDSAPSLHPLPTAERAAEKAAEKTDLGGNWRRDLLNKVRRRSRAVTDNWHFTVLTTAMTFYALFGDDFRLSATHKDTDVVFNTVTLFCILVFSIEIVLASIGKAEYFLGFFFVLDLGSTITLLLDLTWITDVIYCSSATDGAAADRTGRAGRQGARAARTVRIIRLMRLAKLYKTYKTAIEKRELALRRRASLDSVERVPPGEGEDEDQLKDEDALLEEEGENPEGAEAMEKKASSGHAVGAETRVGRKLSDMTTQRVIILVLVMLFVMPLFVTSSYGFQEFRTSGHMGAELVYERWRNWCLRPPNATFAQSSSHLADDLPWCLQELDTPQDSNADERYSSRAWYEEYLLDYVYTHHIGRNFAWRLFWVGFNSTSLADSLGSEAGGAYLGRLVQLNQERFLGPDAALPEDSLYEWNNRFMDEVTLQALQPSFQEKLTKPWVEKCSNFYGVGVTSNYGLDEDLSGCSIYEELRCTEVDYVVPLQQDDAELRHISMVFAFDQRGTSQLEASLSMLQTIFICFAVGIGAVTFSSDAKQLLLNPIERMVRKMEAIKDNPLEAIRLGDREYQREELETRKNQEQLAKKGRCWKLLYQSMNRKEKEPMETLILERTIIKLGGLLALGFGEAGAEVIGQNMQGSHSAGVNAMVPGKKVDCIIGFCNIRHFADATEVLQEKVLVFVNQVAEFVHSCSDDYHGVPNQNIGDSFLLVWRLSGASLERQTKLADMACMSYVRIVAEINKSRVLARYRDHPGLLQRIPQYRVQMGFGLHCGWAIEGAIGSEFKIDASYLSPNVNVASRLGVATKQFNVWVLISHFMIGLMSLEMSKLCRLIDHVTVKGSQQPIRLYTIDLDFKQLQIQPKPTGPVIRNRFKIRQIREIRKTEKWSDEYKVYEAFKADEDIIAMRSTYAPEFFQRFAMAYQNYEVGEWNVARDVLFTCHFVPKKNYYPVEMSESDWPEDGPTTTLLSYMQSHRFCPPQEWAGHRELAAK